MLTLKSGNGSRHHLVEDVVRALESLLGDDTGLLQEIYSLKIISWCFENVIEMQLTSLDISTSQLSRGTEVDTDELTL
jgi:hypothetical protein